MKIRRLLVYLFICPIYWFSCLMYDKKYLIGSLFARDHFSIGWKWVLKYWYVQKVKGINPFIVNNLLILPNALNINIATAYNIENDKTNLIPVFTDCLKSNVGIIPFSD